MIKDSPHISPDVSEIRPVYVPKNGTRSYTMNVVFINGQGRYQTIPGWWNDIDKRWEYASSGLPIKHEVVKTEPIGETKRQY